MHAVLELEIHRYHPSIGWLLDVDVFRKGVGGGRG
jgi:hypothetical protein